MKQRYEYTHFGVMLDMSRNAVMKVSEVKRMIDCLQKMGYNTLELYTEDTYEIKGEPYFGYMRGRYTGAELKDVDAYARAHGIELIPCVQTLAHFTNLVRHRAYAEIVDCNDILLIDEPKTYELIDKIFATLAENFTSRLVNIGMDEAHMVGLGKYLDKHGYQDRFQLLLRHLNKVVEIAKKYGFTPHMWSDMFFRLANKGDYYVQEVQKFSDEVIATVPESVELAYWDYYHTKEKDYDVMFDTHAQFNRKVWFAGGAWSWNGFAPLNWYSVKSMKPAMQSVVKHGIKDVLLTLWGDDGKECSYFSLLPSLYAIRQYADGNFDEDKIKKGFYSLFKIKYDDFMALDLPSRTGACNPDGEEIRQNACKCLLYADPFMGIKDKAIVNVRPIPYTQHVATLKAAAKRAGDFSYLFDTLSKLCSVMATKAELSVKTRRAYEARDIKTLAGLIKDYAATEKALAVFYEAYRALWYRENKAFGFEVQDIRLGGLMQRLKNCRERLTAYVKGKITAIDELEQEILPHEALNYFQYNNYAQTVSFNKL